jgi:acyl-CoA reductase-like NAD-dependent aldehyde dehydrogenase
MPDTVKAAFESRILIDGKLVVDGEAGTFTNINPANEDVLGEVADASTADMNRAIDAARRAFDDTDWSTNHQLRKRCLEQLHEATVSEQEELREGSRSVQHFSPTSTTR